MDQNKNTIKLVINNCYGGFSISRECAELMAKLGDKQAKSELECSEDLFFGYGYSEELDLEYERTNINLIKAIEKLGKKANGDCADLKIIEIPDDLDYYIQEDDGFETVHEQHRIFN